MLPPGFSRDQQQMARILIVEDDEQVRRLIDQILQRAGHDVVAAEDGVDALKLFDQAEFDLIITDLIMPEMEGMQTIRESFFLPLECTRFRYSSRTRAGPWRY